MKQCRPNRHTDNSFKQVYVHIFIIFWQKQYTTVPRISLSQSALCANWFAFRPTLLLVLLCRGWTRSDNSKKNVNSWNYIHIKYERCDNDTFCCAFNVLCFYRNTSFGWGIYLGRFYLTQESTAKATRLALVGSYSTKWNRMAGRQLCWKPPHHMRANLSAFVWTDNCMLIEHIVSGGVCFFYGEFSFYES